MALSSFPLAQIGRFLTVGVVNTAFGYALYAALVAAGLPMFVAQTVGTIIAVMFNHFTYSRHVFVSVPASRGRFLLSYAVNYLVGLSALALSALVFRSPYAAGLLATVIAAATNFMILRRFVFVPQPQVTASSAGPWLRPSAVGD